AEAVLGPPASSIEFIDPIGFEGCPLLPSNLPDGTDDGQAQEQVIPVRCGSSVGVGAGNQGPAWVIKSWEGEHCSGDITFFSGKAEHGQIQTDDGRVEFLPPKSPSAWLRLRCMLPW